MSANTTNILEIQIPNVKTVKKTANVKSTNETKDKPSLFDNLLKKSTTKKTETKTETKIETKTKTETNTQVVSKAETKEDKKIIKKIESKVNLKLEIKIDEKSEPEIEISKNVNVIKNENKKTVDTIKTIQTDIPIKNEKKVSLLDKMILDAKVSKRLKTSKSKDIIPVDKKNTAILKNNLESESKVINNKTESNNIKNNLIKELIVHKDIKTIEVKENKIDNKLNTTIKETKSKNDTTKVPKIKSTVEVKDVKPSTLLDKIVADVKEQTKIKKLHSSLETKVDNSTQKHTDNEKVVLTTSKSIKKVITEVNDISNISEKLQSKTIEHKETDSKIVDSKVTELKTIKQVKTVIKNDKQEIISDVVSKSNITQLENTLPNDDIKSSIPKQTSLIDQVIISTVDNKTQNVNKQKIVKQDSVIQASMFLSSQKELDEVNKVQIISQSKKILEENKNLKGVQKSAKTLKLNATNIEVTNDTKKDITNNENQTKVIDVVQSKQDFDIQIKTNHNMLDKMAFIKNINVSSDHKKEHLQSLENQVVKYQEDTKEIQNKKVLVKDTIEISVPASVAQNITSKIIGARQQVGNFMSNMAREMYLNYKPPLTAFRMNLNPGTLGSISIVMKSDKVNKSMSVSMNMSSNATLESFIDNKTVLQTALQKNFSENSSNISLNFGMQNESSNQSFQQARDGSQNNDRDETKTTNNIEQTIVSEEVQENTDYM